LAAFNLICPKGEERGPGGVEKERKKKRNALRVACSCWRTTAGGKGKARTCPEKEGVAEPRRRKSIEMSQARKKERGRREIKAPQKKKRDLCLHHFRLLGKKARAARGRGPALLESKENL